MMITFSSSTFRFGTYNPVHSTPIATQGEVEQSLGQMSPSGLQSWASTRLCGRQRCGVHWNQWRRGMPPSVLVQQI